MSEETRLPSNPAAEGIWADDRVRDGEFIMSGHHCHSCYELFYVESGACRFLINEHIYDLQAGDFMLIPPLVLHYTRYPFGACHRRLVLFQKQDIRETVVPFMPGQEAFFTDLAIFQTPLEHRALLTAWMKQISAEDGNDPRGALMRKICLQGLFILCSRSCVFLSSPPAQIHTTDQHVVRAARYIAQHYMNPITTSDVAMAVGFSPNYLSRKFRQAAGVGLHEYLVFIRLHRAALELVSTADSITTIAFRCGFSDSNYFKDAFKKKYGVTPRDYRKIM